MALEDNGTILNELTVVSCLIRFVKNRYSSAFSRLPFVLIFQEKRSGCFLIFFLVVKDVVRFFAHCAFH